MVPLSQREEEEEEEAEEAKRLINYDPGERILKTCFSREKRIIRGIVGRLQMRRHRPQRVMHREQDSRTRIQGALTSSMSREPPSDPIQVYKTP